MLLRELGEHGYADGFSQLRAWPAPLLKGEPGPLVRFETPAGQQMQADFTYVLRGRDSLLALVVTLGYSRATFVKFFAGSGEDVGTLCAGLRQAFDYSGGGATSGRSKLNSKPTFAGRSVATSRVSRIRATEPPRHWNFCVR